MKPSSLKNKINPKKLLLSKWTSVDVLDREKHFIVTKVHWQEGSTDSLDQVTIEAILTKKSKMIPWENLKDNSQWLPGWK
ncbi:TIGR02450 family Trp-rich protein [Leptospira biflexa]|uniref:TIGR02450 family Trp-rich protein n=1 Tax=Leptospira biflexa TaxID=172 RepID=UPI001090E571|nr:TIGR02450 family Trp-rich protein [Leptospira biflexa]TGM42625.1 TIGR02450 family Trp-rich protein [Leptospira biflexa]TGM45703.1 TIGR02450 family Trp-rich protein [Leptospira biflexa]